MANFSFIKTQISIENLKYIKLIRKKRNQNVKN